jgi:phosphohistidine swiveling domain-containing protein
MLVREELRSEMMRVNLTDRRDLLEAGRRLAARGRLDAPGDVFHLTFDELKRALLEDGFDARGAAARERARLAAWRRVEVPNRFASEEASALGRDDAAQAPPGELLQGLAVSPGEVEGPARLLRSPDDEGKMRPGDILVAPATDPGWTPLFASAAGVVVEIGGVMSHSATVAREYGLPCVANIEGALERLRDGDLVRVDGARGTVQVLARGADASNCSHYWRCRAPGSTAASNPSRGRRWHLSLPGRSGGAGAG